MTAGDGEGLVCGHCGSMDERVAVFYDLETVGTSPVACPDCQTPLTEARIEGCPVVYCASCHGVLVEMKHFVTLSDAVRAASPGPAWRFRRRQRPGDRVLPCPVCGQPMLSHLTVVLAISCWTRARRAT